MGSSRFVKEAALEEYVAFVKQIIAKPVVTVGRFTSPDTMVSQVKKGITDFIGAARPSIADPFLPKKIQEGQIDDIRECIGCNICYAHDARAVPIRCTQNPTMGEEWRRGWHPEYIAPQQSDSSILVVGAGPAGLEATRALGQRGYDVTLAEATTELAGRVAAECRLPGLSEWRRVIEYRIQQIKQMPNVKVYLDSRLTAKDILSYDFDRVILATGARWRRDGVSRWHNAPAEHFDSDRIFTPDDIMADVEPSGPVVLFDDDHYYMGPVLAEKLRTKGLEVTVVTPANAVGEWSFNTEELARTQSRLLNLGVKILTGKAVNAFDGEAAEITCVYTAKSFQQPAASLVTVTARRPYDELYWQLTSDPDALKQSGIKSVERIGDCRSPGIIAAAVHAGHRTAREMDALDADDVPFRRERVTV
jgi:dimethylamine/trimethylamine dehydrogenase